MNEILEKIEVTPVFSDLRKTVFAIGIDGDIMSHVKAKASLFDRSKEVKSKYLAFLGAMSLALEIAGPRVSDYLGPNPGCDMEVKEYFHYERMRGIDPAPESFHMDDMGCHDILISF